MSCMTCNLWCATCNHHISGQVLAEQHTRLPASNTGYGRNTVPSIHAVTSTLPGGNTTFTAQASVPSISATEGPDGTLSYPTSALTQGGSGYSKHTTTKPMTVIYLMSTGRGNTLPTGLWLPVTFVVLCVIRTPVTCNPLVRNL